MDNRPYESTERRESGLVGQMKRVLRIADESQSTALNT